MQYTTAFFGVTAAYGCINAAVQSLGYPSFPTINNLASVFGIRLIWMNFIYVLNPGFEMLFMCYPISWCTSAVISIICLCYAYNKHWKKVTPAVAEA
jgi:Na+-driven multidrug efflux pump